MSLLRMFSVLIATASYTSLVIVSHGFDNTLMLDQSTGWLWFHACSVRTEGLKSACLTAHLVLSILSTKVTKWSIEERSYKNLENHNS